MYGVFQTHYETVLLASESSSSISWIGSIQGCLLFLVSVVTGRLYDAGYLRTLVFVGTVLIVLGMMFTSICETYWQLFLAQGVVMGVGEWDGVSAKHGGRGGVVRGVEGFRDGGGVGGE